MKTTKNIQDSLNKKIKETVQLDKWFVHILVADHETTIELQHKMNH